MLRSYIPNTLVGERRGEVSKAHRTICSINQTPIRSFHFILRFGVKSNHNLQNSFISNLLPNYQNLLEQFVDGIYFRDKKEGSGQPM